MMQDDMDLGSEKYRIWRRDSLGTCFAVDRKSREFDSQVPVRIRPATGQMENPSMLFFCVPAQPVAGSGGAGWGRGGGGHSQHMFLLCVSE